MGQAKRNQQRHCPARGEIITPAVCATNRNSEIACPPDCPHNPFNPEHYLGIYQPLEAEVVKNLSIMLYQDSSFTGLAQIKKAVIEKDDFRTNALHVWHIHGENRVTKWLGQGALREWKNDEIVMALALDTMRGAILEVQGALDDRSTLVRDLLRPDERPFVLIDRLTAAEACRFDVYITWVYGIPGGHYRLSGVAQVVQDFGTLDYPDVFSILIKHLGAPDNDREKWILENMLLISQALSATQTARTARQYEISDLVTYERTCLFGRKGSPPNTAAVRKFATTVMAHPRVCDDGPGDPGPILRATLLAAPFSDKHPVECVGTIAVFPDGKTLLSSLGRKNAGTLLDFMKTIEPSFAVSDETSKDLGKEKIDGMPYCDLKLVPPALLENVSEIAMQSHRIPSGVEKNPIESSLRSGFEKYADLPVPALDGRSPRDAAADPALRPRLASLMKRQVNMVDQQRRTNAVDFDINPLLEELGLTELIHRPSPLGTVKSAPGIEDDNEGDFLEMPPPQLPIRGKELERRLMAASNASLAALADDGPICEFLMGIEDLTDDFTPSEVDAIIFAISLAHTILHPHPPVDYAPDPEGMMDRFDDYCEQLMALETDEDCGAFIDRITDETRQPDIVTLCVSSFETRRKSQVKNERIREDMMTLMLLACCAALCEITLWPPSRL